MTDEPTVLIAGAGNIGRAMHTLLTCHLSIGSVKVIDANPEITKHDDYHCVDDFLDDPAKYIRGHTYFVNTLPVYDPDLVMNILDACVECGAHYLDFSEDIHVADRIKTFCEASGGALNILVSPHSGLAPGFVQTVAHSITEHFDVTYQISMNVGALPMSATNPMKYINTWSADGVINEYRNVARVLVNGQLQERLPLSEREMVVINGIEYESFLTSGGCSTLLDTWKGSECYMSYKTVRYPGHLDYVKKHALWNTETQRYDFHGEFEYELRSTQPIYMIDDTVVMLVEAIGEINDEPKTAQFSHQIICPEKESSPLGYRRLSAIQRMTAGGASSVIDLHLREKIKQTGYLKHEEVALKDVLSGYYRSAMGFK